MSLALLVQVAGFRGAGGVLNHRGPLFPRLVSLVRLTRNSPERLEELEHSDHTELRLRRAWASSFVLPGGGVHLPYPVSISQAGSL